MIQSKTPDVRSMLLALKVPPVLAEMSIPYMWFMPGGVSPDSQPVMEIVQGAQRGLQRLGYARISVNGILDAETAAALNSIVTPKGSFIQTPWVKIYGQILAALRDPRGKAQRMQGGAPPAGLGGYFTAYDAAPGPLPGWMVGLPPGPMGMGETSMDGGVELIFGAGVTNKTNMIPVNDAAKSAFKTIQRQINRLFTKFPGGAGARLPEDGVIGEDTLSSLIELAPMLGSFASTFQYGTTQTIAQKAITVGNFLKQKADSMGIAESANQGAKTTVTSAVENFLAPAAPGGSSSIKKYLPYAILAGGVAFWAAKRKKGRHGR